ncbi:p21-C-terminal region-binding protein-domain-containing protein [Talaromyces proteolyticus]|uniref:Protein BCP1 n=1 Tax=Talaromyces proteolyticus TaxID=1131652 RepID=A0AAD4PZH6_9EURO|nr:p21-C-terminal region-binding protein-domain-containing protein [Talaromyces proteolyticus]KAH8696397.1 p21-C-terminal region-binding protein-domain-containing protein [Talaromyces proteolyticus]
MGKRKSLKDADNDVSMSGQHGDDDSGSDSDTDLVNVEFEWFDPQPDVDFHGLKTLLRQLLDTDAQLFDMSALADLILAQPLLGSTVKVDGKETDPYAFLSVINLKEHKDKQVIQDLIKYLSQKSSSTPALSALSQLLSKSDTPAIGLILTDRLINIPVQVIPPMYTMLLEEIAWAIEDKEPYTFTHYLILSKTYDEVESKLDAEESRPQKKKKKTAATGGKLDTMFYFHPEDEVLEKYSLCHATFEYTNKQAEGAADSKRAFQELGIKPAGSLMLIEAGKFEEAVKAITEYVNAPI